MLREPVPFNFIFLIFLLLQFPYRLGAQELYLGRDTFVEGEILRPWLYPVEPDDSVRFVLKTEEGRTVSQSKGIPFSLGGEVDKELSGGKVYRVLLGLLGISAGISDGTYELTAEWQRAEKKRGELKRLVTIESAGFSSQTIRLDAKNSDLLTPGDPVLEKRKRDEAVRLWNILGNNDLEHFHDFGVLLWPVEEDRGWVSSKYGFLRRYEHPDGRVTKSSHKGFDIAAANTESVLASLTGEIVMAEDRFITGNTVILSPLPGVYLKYQHMDSMAVQVGDRVERGDVLGKVGRTGLATGNHLHFELWVSGNHVEPSHFFGAPLIDTTGILSMIVDRQ